MARRRKAHGGHANHERWLLTYADMITLLLALFIIMYGISAVDKSKYIELSESLSKAFGASSAMSVINTGGANNKGILPPASSKVLPAVIPMPERQMLAKIKSEVEKEARKAGLQGKIEAAITQRGLVISISDAVFFASGEATIRPDMQPLLRRIMAPLGRMPNSIRIEGHTDNTPIHTAQFPSNWELSTARATNVIRYILSLGLFEPRRLAAAGYGEYWPKSPNTTEGNRAKNRRVDIVVLRSSQNIEKPW